MLPVHTVGQQISGTIMTATIVVVSGNPRVGSRTLTVGRKLADRLTDRLTDSVVASPGGPSGNGGPAVTEIEVASVAADLLTRPQSAAVADALEVVRRASLLVVATPVYKAAYTGLLKIFLDHFQAGELSLVVAVPVVVAGSPAHTFVGELYLRPLLTEIGAVVPAPAFTVTEGQLKELDSLVGAWVDRHGCVLARQLGTDRRPVG